MSDWKEYLDANSGKKYYYNSITQETQWSIPTELVVVPPAPPARVVVSIPVVVTPVQLGPEVVLIYQNATTRVPSGWMKLMDTASGNYYYTHYESATTAWSLPNDVVLKMVKPQADFEPSPEVSTHVSASFSSLVLPQSNVKRTASFNASAVSTPLVSVTSPVTGPTVPLKSGSLRGPSSTPLQPKMSSFSNLGASRPGIPSQFTSGAYFVTAPVARTISEDDGPAPSVEAEPDSDFDQLFDAPPVAVIQPRSTAMLSDSLSPRSAMVTSVNSKSQHNRTVSAMPSHTHGTLSKPSNMAQQSMGSSSGAALAALLRPKLALDIQQDIAKFQLKSFAQDHFSVFRKHHFFSSDEIIVVDDVLSWQADTVYKNLLKSSNKSDSLRSFRWIQSFMGEGSEPAAKGTDVQLVALGVSTSDIRDEIFCQLCKQTSSNPNVSSTAKGWKLMVLCASAFSPSAQFQDHLFKYLRASCTLPETTLTLSSLADFYVSKRLAGSNSHPLVLAQLDSILVNGFDSIMCSFFYGVDQLMTLQRTMGDALPHPRILNMLCDSIRMLGGHHQQGIFRLASSKNELLAVRSRLENGEVISTSDANVPADLLKIWFRNLPQPLIPFQYFDECMSTADRPDSCLALVQRVCSPDQLAIFHFMAAFFIEMAESSAETSMSLDNLALVFAPGMVRTQIDDPNLLLQFSSKQKQFLKNVIEKWPR